MSHDHGTPIVIALGGNSISVPNQEGNIDQQFLRTRETVKQIANVIEAGYAPIITHGNGPQVGNILRRVEIASNELYSIPLEICVADTQAGMGYMIGQLLTNELHQRSISREVVTLVTNVLVDADDPAFDAPSKPIGPRMPAEIAKRHEEHDNWSIKEVADGFYRRIVPSPIPETICELETIRQLSESGRTVICCGGGGIPVMEQDGLLRGAAAVIDKDRTTALLSCHLNVETMIIATGVDRVCLNFGRPDQVELDSLTTDQAKQYLLNGEFAEGSMRPKVEAAIDFVTRSRQANPASIISHIDKLSSALSGDTGTRLVRA
jgi:carbamate kinase